MLTWQLTERRIISIFYVRLISINKKAKQKNKAHFSVDLEAKQQKAVNDIQIIMNVNKVWLIYLSA